jgi:hypothetical protein
MESFAQFVSQVGTILVCLLVLGVLLFLARVFLF